MEPIKHGSNGRDTINRFTATHSKCPPRYATYKVVLTSLSWSPMGWFSITSSATMSVESNSKSDSGDSSRSEELSLTGA